MILKMGVKGQEVAEVFRITSPYGAWESFRDHAHTGLDYAMNMGTELHPLMDGVVSRIVDQGAEGLGKGVFVQMQNGDTAIYGHLSEINVQVGDHVGPSDVIGLSGSSGMSTGPHLHLGIVDQAGNFQDPSAYDAIVQSWDPSLLLQTKGGLWGVIEGGRDWATQQSSEMSGEIAVWMLNGMKEAFLMFGKWMLMIGPDAAIMISMIFCLGAICSIPKMAKWAVASVTVAFVLEVIRIGVMAA